MKSGQCGSQHILPERQPKTLLSWTSVCSQKTQGSFHDPMSTFKLTKLFESTPDNEKGNQTLPASLRLQLECQVLRPPETKGLKSQEESRTSFPGHLSVPTVFIPRARQEARKASGWLSQ